MVYVTAIKMTSSGAFPEHITHVQWLDSSSGTSGTMSTAQTVEWLAEGNAAHVASEAGPAPVRVVKVGRGAHLRTSPDGSRADNLLSLPRI